MKLIIISGNVGRDAEYSEKDGRGMAKFSVAVNTRVKNDAGQYENVPEWYNVTVFGKQAEFCKSYVKKGRVALVNGVPTPRYYKNKLEEIVPVIDVLANSVELADKQKDANQQQNAPQSQPVQPVPEGFVHADDDELPF